MSAFLGLWLSMGIFRKPTMASYLYESQQTWLYNTPTFTKIMRRDRFHWIILQCVHANNNAGALPRGNLNHDPAHKVRRIFDLINKVFKEKYAAARDLLGKAPALLFACTHCKIIQWNRSRRIILVNVGVLYNQVC
jgi:hypothetical protein